MPRHAVLMLPAARPLLLIARPTLTSLPRPSQAIWPTTMPDFQPHGTPASNPFPRRRSTAAKHANDHPGPRGPHMAARRARPPPVGEQPASPAHERCAGRWGGPHGSLGVRWMRGLAVPNPVALGAAAGGSPTATAPWDRGSTRRGVEGGAYGRIGGFGGWLVCLRGGWGEGGRGDRGDRREVGNGGVKDGGRENCSCSWNDICLGQSKPS
jgi:hypothetical protein